jgi:hypothetical protein
VASLASASLWLLGLCASSLGLLIPMASLASSLALPSARARMLAHAV